MATMVKPEKPHAVETESITQEYLDRIARALEAETSKLKEREEQNRSLVIARAKEEAERAVAEARQQARAETEQAIAGARELRSGLESEMSRVLTLVRKNVEQAIADTEAKMKAELDRLSGVIAEAETRLLSPPETSVKEPEVKPHRPVREPARAAAPVARKAEPAVPSNGHKQAAPNGKNGGRMFKGSIGLEVVSPFGRGRVDWVKERLDQIPGLKIVATANYAGFNRVTTTYHLELERATPLIEVLKGMDSVEDIAEHDSTIVMKLK
jgi:hypothetical protein